MSDWLLAIDFGTSFTAGAVRSNGSAKLLDLSTPRGAQQRTSSSVLVRDRDEILVGWLADNQAASAPDRYVRSPKRLLASVESMPFGGTDVPVATMTAAVLRSVLDEARRQRNQTEPAEVRLTHPASWGSDRIDALRAAAADAGIRAPTLIEEPVAAAVHFGLETLTAGERLAVYDLGGGTFDVAVLERTEEGNGFEVRAVGGSNELGGEIFDERLIEHARGVLQERNPGDAEKLASSRRLLFDFERAVREAKEGLSDTAAMDVWLPVGLETESIQVTQAELEAVIAADFERSLDLLEQTIDDAGLTPRDLKGIFLAGGSSRLWFVYDRVLERFGKADTLEEPKSVVALGAAKAPVERKAKGKPTPGPEPPPPPPPRAQTQLRVVAANLHDAVVVGASAFVLVTGDDDALAVVRVRLADSELEEILKVGERPADEEVRLYAADSRLVLRLGTEVGVLDHELNVLDSHALGHIHAVAVGRRTFWVRDLGETPKADQRSQTVMFPVRFSRVALEPGVSTLSFDGGMDAICDLWPFRPPGFDLTGAPGSDDVVAISSRVERLKVFGGTPKAEQILAPLGPALRIGQRPTQLKVDAPPWYEQVLLAHGRCYVARTDGLFLADSWDAMAARSWRKLLDPAPYPLARWLLAPGAAFGVTASEEETVVYALRSGAPGVLSLDPVARRPGFPASRPVGRIWADVDGPPHLVAAEEAGGAWISVVSAEGDDVRSALLLLGNDGAIAQELVAEAVVLPVAADDASVYGLAAQDDDRFALVAVARG